MKNRLELPKLFAQKGFKRGVEVGTAQGRFAQIMLDTIPDLELTCVDSYEGKWAVNYEIAKEALGDRVIKGHSTDVVNTIEAWSLDFVYIDAAHDYDNVKADIEAWAPKVKAGGIVAGDDYYLTRHGNLGVIKAVNEYCEKHLRRLHTTLWDLNAHEDDQQPNWWFQK